MIFSPQFVAVLDACVLYPAPIRDILLNLADLEIFLPKWSEIIQDEWMRNLLENRPDLTKAKLSRTVNAMNNTFPDAEVHDFEEMIDFVELPDPNDRHVVAAAIKSKANAIITFNKKDFPNDYLSPYNLVAYDPDAFITLLDELSSEIVREAFNNQLVSLKNPPKTKDELISILEKCGLKKAALLFG
jgi:predicted nucleic acid-binding protein